MSTPFKITQTIALTDREIKHIKKGKTAYKLIDKKWVKLVKKEKKSNHVEIESKLQKLLKQAKQLKKQLKG